MKRSVPVLAMLAALAAGPVLADVAVTDVGTWKTDQHAQNEQKKLQKILRRTQKSGGALSVLTPQTPKPLATGSQALIDASGVKYFINTNITFSTSSSASGAMSEASYTGPVAATTLNGGTVSTTLNDAFDGYNSLWFSQTSTGPAQTGNAAFIPYNKTGGAASTDCGGRRVVLPKQTIYGLVVQRRVFVPANDSFARWETVLTNPTGAAVTVNVISSNNLGSDSNTLIDSSSSGDNVATTSDTWVSTFQNYSGTTSSDPRLAHVMWGAGGISPNKVNFVNGDDNPYWTFPVTVAPGQTKILLHFVVVQPSRAAARAKAASLVTNPLPVNAVACLTNAEQAQFANFGAAALGEPLVPTLGRTGLLALVAAIAAAGFFAHRRIA
jgi:hypothetical protein